MRGTQRRSGGIREIITFWSIVLCASVLLCGLAFLGGKYWIGGLMAKSNAQSGLPRVSVQTPEPTDPDANNPDQTEPPPSAVVKLQQRAPTDAERTEIEQTHPQDGAGLNQAGQGDESDASTGSDDKPLNGGDSDKGDDEAVRYRVVAGSYANRENAQREFDDLTARGYSPTIKRVERNGKTYHRVTVASFRDRQEAERVRDELTAAGKEATVTTH